MRKMKRAVILWVQLMSLFAVSAGAMTPDWSHPRGSNASCSADESGVHFCMDEKAASVTAWSVSTPFSVSSPGAEGISFEVKGDGSRYYASIFLSCGKFVHSGYEAVFLLSSTEWTKISIRFRDFVENHKPWSVAGRMDVQTLQINPANVSTIGFGRGNHFHKFYPTESSFSIRNIQLEQHMPDNTIATYTYGMENTLAKLKKKQPVKILLLGDSITDFGKDESYAVYCGRKLKEKFGSDIVVENCGVGGHSVRGGEIVLPRSLRAMPDPDMVCIFYGANDCKAVSDESGFDERVFQLQVERLVDKVRQETNGKADILLINGVPRLNKERMQSTGEVERISGAFRHVAAEKDTGFLDTMSVYRSLSKKEWDTYYKDTIHQNAKGLAHIGLLMYDGVVTGNE